MARQETLFTLEWATVSLYPVLPMSETRTNPWGQADEANPVFMGAKANALRLMHRFEEVQRAPTGRKHPVIKHVNSEHSISIERLWVTRPDLADDSAEDDYELQRNQQFIMAIAWQQAPPLPLTESRWLARVYYGVKMSTFDLASQETVSFVGEQSLKAEFYKRLKGVGTIPAELAASPVGGGQ